MHHAGCTLALLSDHRLQRLLERPGPGGLLLARRLVVRLEEPLSLDVGVGPALLLPLVPGLSGLDPRVETC